MEYPEFINSDAYSDLHDGKSEKARLQAMLTNLTRVHLLTANQFDSFDALIREYLQAGIEIFHLETGIVSRISGGTYTVCDVISPLNVLEKGQMFELKDTYCQIVYDSKQIIGLPEVGKLSYLNSHPVYQNLKLEAYLSAPIYVESELFGTLNFTSLRPRKLGFSEHEHTLISLLAHSIGAYLQLREKEQKLKALNLQIKKFAGYVAHDLRNPLGSISTLAALGKRVPDIPKKLDRILSKIRESSDSALELVTTILDSTALGVGKLELHKEDVKLEQLSEKAKESVYELATETDKEVVTLFSPDANAYLDTKRILQALTNLLINAIKYSPPKSRIEFTAAETILGSHFKVRNSISHQNMTHEAVGKVQSIGFGLEIVRDILQAHGSELKIDADDNHYEVSFTIAHKER